MPNALAPALTDRSTALELDNLECAALLDVMAGRAQLSLSDLRRGRAFLVRIVQMLTRLSQR